MHLLPAATIFTLLLTGGTIASVASASPAVLLSLSGGIVLTAFFAKSLPLALPVAAASGLVTFSLALNSHIPWTGVAGALLLVAWAGTAHLRYPVPAALAAGFFGAVILAFDLWRGPTGQLLDPTLIPSIAIPSAALGVILLSAGRKNPLPASPAAARNRPGSRPFLHPLSSLLCAAVAIALTASLASPMGTFAAHLREALGGPPAPSTSETASPTSESTGHISSDNFGKSLPLRADFNLSHDFELLVRLDSPADAAGIASSQIYCRTMVFDRYEANRWLPPDTNEWFEDPQDGSIDQAVRVAPDPPPHFANPLFTHTIFVPASPNLVLPSLQGIVRFELPRVIKMGDATFGHPSRLDHPLRYRARSAIRNADLYPPSALRSAPSGSPYDLQLPPGPHGSLIRNLAAQIVPQGANLPASIAAIRSHLLTSTSYSTRIDNPKNLPPLENFLLHEKRGYCEFYATAGTLLLRASGFPARTAFGFSGGERGSNPRDFVFFSDDGHAWTEVHLDHIGWAIVDFTPPGQGAAAPPSPPNPGSPSFGQVSFASLLEIDLEANNASPNPAIFTAAQGMDLGSSLAIVSVLLLITVATILLRRDRRVLPSSSGIGSFLSPPAPEPSFYRAFCEAAAKAGFPKTPGQTPKEHLAAIAATSPGHAQRFRDLVDYYYSVRYEGAPPDPRRERSFRISTGSLPIS